MDKFDIATRVRELNAASEAYYNSDKPIMSDYEFDCKFDELKKWEDETGIVLSNSPTQNVGYDVVSNLEKTTHSHPMLSLGKTKSVDDLINFSSGKDCVISLKMDGLTVLNTYENGKLQKSETRGNGEVGEVITHNAKVFEGFPINIPFDRKFEIEGEAIITKNNFERININGEYKTCRNLASGSVRQLDSKFAKDRHVHFVAWKVPFGLKTYTEGFRIAEDYGFEVVPYVTYNSNTDDINEKIEQLKAIANEKSYPIDGLVISYNNVEYGKSLGMTGHHPKHSLAFKFYDEESVSTLKDIEWSMGKTGNLTPVAVFEPIEIDGTQVERASLHNVSILKDLELGIGDEITVVKCNQIIPQIKDNLTRSNTCEIPSICPICRQPTKIIKENDSEVLMCTNPDCKGKLLGKLTHAVSRDALNISGLSESTLDRLIKFGWITSIKDIYHLDFYKNHMIVLEGFGKKSIDKLLESIEESRNTNLERFLYSLSVPLLGKSASKMIAEAVDYSFEEFMREMVIEGANYFRDIPGIGNVLIQSLDDYFNKNCASIFQLSKEFTFGKKKDVLLTDYNSINLTGKTFVITGKLNHYENRDAAKEDIETHGGKVTGSVTSKTDYLINNDLESTSGKNKKAKELGVQIISEDQLLEMLK